MLHLNLPENATVADLIASLQRCPQNASITDDTYNPITAVVIDRDGDVMISHLKRINPESRTTMRFKMDEPMLGVSDER